MKTEIEGQDFCFCSDEVSLQIVSGGAAPEGLYGKVTLKVGEEYVDYVKAGLLTAAQVKVRKLQAKVRELEADLLVWKPKAPVGYETKTVEDGCDGCAFQGESCRSSSHITYEFLCDNIIFIKEQK